MQDIATGYSNFKDLGNDFFECRLGKKRNTSLYAVAKGNPQGGVQSNLEDHFLFAKALKENKLIKKETFQLFSTTKTFARKYDAGEIYCGYGFELEKVNEQRVIGHGGGDLGISTALRIYPDSGDYTVIVLSNYDRGGILAIIKLQELVTYNK